MRPGQARELCGNCGKLRPLKTITVRYQGESRMLDMCRPCTSAVKEALKHQEEMVNNE